MKVKVVETAKKAVKPLVKFASAGVGIAGSALLLQKVGGVLPASWPALVRKVGPGVATMIISYLLSTKVSDERLKALALGVGAGGALDAIRKVISDIPALSQYASNLPALSGSPGYQAVATTSPGWDYYLQNSLQGLGTSPYALNGDTTFSMQGPGNGGGMQSANAYALNGMSMQGPGPFALT